MQVTSDRYRFPVRLPSPDSTVNEIYNEVIPTKVFFIIFSYYQAVTQRCVYVCSVQIGRISMRIAEAEKAMEIISNQAFNNVERFYFHIPFKPILT